MISLSNRNLLEPSELAAAVSSRPRAVIASRKVPGKEAKDTSRSGRVGQVPARDEKRAITDARALAGTRGYAIVFRAGRTTMSPGIDVCPFVCTISLQVHRESDSTVTVRWRT